MLFRSAERDHAMRHGVDEATSSRLVIRSTSGVSMHSEPRDMVLVARDVRGPWPDHVQRDTTSDGMLAFGHSRSGFMPSWLSRQSSRLVSGRPRVRIVAGGTTRHVAFV